MGSGWTPAKTIGGFRDLLPILPSASWLNGINGGDLLMAAFDK